MKFIPTLASLLVCSLSSSLLAQDKIAPLKIGDPVPDIILENMVNYSGKTAHLSDFKGKLLILDFWATWCGPCKMFAPVIDEIAEGNLPGVKVGKVDVDQQPDLAGQFRVMSIPTLVLFKDGKAAVTSVGVKSKKEVLEMIEKLR